MYFIWHFDYGLEDFKVIGAHEAKDEAVAQAAAMGTTSSPAIVADGVFDYPYNKTESARFLGVDVAALDCGNQGAPVYVSHDRNNTWAP